MKFVEGGKNRQGLNTSLGDCEIHYPCTSLYLPEISICIYEIYGGGKKQARIATIHW